MIEYNSELNIYIVHFSDDSAVKGWIRQLNGLVFAGLNTTYVPEWPHILDELLLGVNDRISKEMPVIVLGDNASHH